MAIGICLDHCENIGMPGMFLKSFEVFEQAVRAKLDPCALLEPGCVLSEFSHDFFLRPVFLLVLNGADKPAEVLWAASIS
jgi:hypothetical protein